MSDYCTLRESDGVFLIYEVKNADGSCRDHKLGQPEWHACATCSFCAPPSGKVKQNEMLMRFRQLQDVASAAGEPGDHGLSAYISALGVQQAFEAAQAYYFGRFSVVAPDHLPVCRHFSTVQDHVPCAIANQHDRCTAWKPTTSSNMYPGLFVTAAFGKTPQ
jgi:hypothetical protein